MVLYESAKLPHGRYYPLKGNYYDNLFVHYFPAKVWYNEEHSLSGVAPEKILTVEDISV